MVPNSLGAVDDRWNNHEGILGVYRKTVQLEAPEDGEQTAINLESCYFSCRVFVNGEEVGQTRGGYLPSRSDITDVARPGENSVAVVVDYRQSTMGELSRIQDFYWNWGGLLQEVRIERTPEVALTDLRAEGKQDGTLTLRPTGVNGTDAPKKVNAVVEVTGPDGSRVLGPQRVSTKVPTGGGKAEPVVLRINNPALWDLKNPNLYSVKLRGAGGALTERTGFRDVSVSGGDVLLNGEVVEDLQGFDRHADYPGLGRTQPDGLARREMEELHEKGFRIFRPAHYPTTPAELDAADELGMLVIEEVNVTGLSGAELASSEIKRFGADQLTGMIQRDRSHPSIIAWSVGNENLTEQTGAPEYVRDTIAVGKDLDPTRLYTQVTFRGTRDRTYRYQDLIAHNYYAGWYTDDTEDVTRLLDSVQEYAGGKPILLSEYGAEAVIGRSGTGKGTEFYQGYNVDEHNRLLAGRKHFLGKMYWTSTEFWCRPDWGGGNPDPVPPFHTKGLQGLYRDDNKLGWRVMFSPVRLSSASVVEAPPGKQAEVPARVTMKEVLGKSASGTLVVEAPEGFEAEPAEQPFQIAPNEEKTVDVTLRGVLPDVVDQVQGRIRAVIDGDTEAQPRLLTIRRADTVRHPAADAFGEEQLDDEWTIVREERSGWSLTDRPDSLRLSTLPGSQTGSASDGKNLFLRDNTPGGDFTAVADVQADVDEDFQQVGLYGYAGDDAYVKAGLGHIDGRRAVEFIREVGGRVVQRASVPVDSASAKLRLVRRGDQFFGEYLTDGEYWFEIGSGNLSGEVRIGLQALGGGTAPPVVPTYVNDLQVLVPGHVEVTGIDADLPLFGGGQSPVAVSVNNSTAEEVRVTASVGVPEEWTSGRNTEVVAPFSSATLEVPVIPSAPAPSIETLTARVSAEDERVYGAPSLDVISVPRGDTVPLALDSGSPTDPVLSTYNRLSPAETWDPVRGYGWIGGPPISRDRGQLDDLRRDFTLSRGEPTTLRLAVPAGRHRVYVLTGDASFPSGNTTISENGQVLAESGDEIIPQGQFEWFSFVLHGGTEGRTTDLQITGDLRDGYWRLNSLVMLP